VRVALSILVLSSAGCALLRPASTAPIHNAREVGDLSMEMVGFLLSVAQRQQEYQRTEGRYAATLRALSVGRPVGYEVHIVEAGEHGWSAEALSTSPRIGCSIFAGVVSALPEPTHIVQSQAGQPYCLFIPPAE
jgi:hypothetical protein